MASNIDKPKPGDSAFIQVIQDCTTLNPWDCIDGSYQDANGQTCMLFIPPNWGEGYPDGMDPFDMLICAGYVTLTDYDCEYDFPADYDCDCNCSNGAHTNNAGDCNNFDGHGDSDCIGVCTEFCQNQNPGEIWSGRSGGGTGRVLAIRTPGMSNFRPRKQKPSHPRQRGIGKISRKRRRR